MYDVRHTADDQPDEALAALPPAAIRCLRACSCTDHARAEQLRAAHQKRPITRLHASSKRTECRASELARETR